MSTKINLLIKVKLVFGSTIFYDINKYKQISELNLIDFIYIPLIHKGLKRLEKEQVIIIFIW